MNLLITRPQPDAERTAAALRAQKHNPVVAPLLVMEKLRFRLDPSRAFGGLIFSSANAVRAIPGEVVATLRHLPVVAVGDRTARTARELGFASVESADGDADHLARHAATVFRDAGLPILYPAGENRAADLAGVLAAHGIRVETVVVYRMVFSQGLPHAAHDAIAERKIDGVLHYSRRTVDAYLQFAEADNVLEAALAPVHYCLSADIGARLIAAGASAVRIAPHPHERELIRLLPPEVAPDSSPQY